VWSQRRADHVAPTDSARPMDVSPVELAIPTTVPEGPAPSIAASTPPTSVAVSVSTAAPVAPTPPTSEKIDRHRAPALQPSPQTPRVNDAVDPLFIEKPGY
jgi:hypothetical protein